MNWEIVIDIYTLPCVKQLVGTFCIVQGVNSVLCGDLDGWDGGWEGDPRGRGYMYTYS